MILAWSLHFLNCFRIATSTTESEAICSVKTSPYNFVYNYCNKAKTPGVKVKTYLCKSHVDGTVKRRLCINYNTNEYKVEEPSREHGWETIDSNHGIKSAIAG